MNVDLKIKIPLINSEGDKQVVLLNTQLFLTPFYCIEADVLSPFSSLKNEQLPWVRQLIFNASLTVYRLTKLIEKLNILPIDDLYLIRRDFTICLVTNDMAKQLNKDAVNQQSRSKSLGDFSVSTTVKGDTTALSKIFSDSNQCIGEMKNLIADLELSRVLPATFVKGRYNPNTVESNRLWWNSDLPLTAVDGFASKKFRFNGSKYKAGTLNLDHYHKHGHNQNALEYYQSIIGVGNTNTTPGGETEYNDLLSKFSEDSEGNLLYNGKYPLTGYEGD